MMNDYMANILTTMVVIFIILALASIPYTLGKWAGYREGQIDAMTGATYYKLEKQSNFEFKWVECEGICRYEEGE